MKGFDTTIWDEKKLDIVVEGNKAKFSQNPELKDFLLKTGNARLVEASPYDKIWGIGMDIECLFLKKVDSIFTLKINNSISVRNQLTSLLAKVDMFSEMVDSFPEKVDFVRI